LACIPFLQTAPKRWALVLEGWGLDVLNNVPGKYFHCCCWFLLAFFLLPGAVLAKTIQAQPNNYLQQLKTLQPGDTLLLQTGVYQDGLPIHHLIGRPDQVITIAAADPQQAPLFLARRGRNTVSILDSAYVTIRNLVLEGRNLPVDAVKAEGHARWAHHITLAGLVIRGHGNNQQTVAISTKCPAWGWVIRGNIIDGAGTGMYLGNSDGSDAFVGGLIEGNLIMNTLGYNLQIKHQKKRESVEGMPSERRTTIIRHNVFSKATGSGSPETARPNVLVGHWPLSGGGKDDLYQIYGNFFYQNPNEALFQGEGNIALYNNLFVNGLGDAVHIQPHNDVPREIAIFYNTVVAAGEGIVIRKPEADVKQLVADNSQRVLANVVFAEVPVRAEQQSGNVTGQRFVAENYLNRPLARLGEVDLRPRDKLTARFDPAPMQNYLEWNFGFNGNPRKAGEVGAYAVEQVSAYWVPRLERKPTFVLP